MITIKWIASEKSLHSSRCAKPNHGPGKSEKIYWFKGEKTNTVAAR